jgi:hypothetical protein
VGLAVEAASDPPVRLFWGEDPTYETMEMLEVSEVMKQVGGLISSRIVVMAGCAVEAFSVIFRPDLVSRLDSFSFLH